MSLKHLKNIVTAAVRLNSFRGSISVSQVLVTIKHNSILVLQRTIPS
jgi:hypothetical protein